MGPPTRAGVGDNVGSGQPSTERERKERHNQDGRRSKDGWEIEGYVCVWGGREGRVEKEAL